MTLTTIYSNRRRRSHKPAWPRAEATPTRAGRGGALLSGDEGDGAGDGWGKRWRRVVWGGFVAKAGFGFEEKGCAKASGRRKG